MWKKISLEKFSFEIWVKTFGRRVNFYISSLIRAAVLKIFFFQNEFIKNQKLVLSPDSRHENSWSLIWLEYWSNTFMYQKVFKRILTSVLMFFYSRLFSLDEKFSEVNFCVFKRNLETFLGETTFSRMSQDIKFDQIWSYQPHSYNRSQLRNRNIFCWKRLNLC